MTRRNCFFLAASFAVSAFLGYQYFQKPERALAVAPAAFTHQVAGGGSFTTIAVGHEYRQDDLPAIAVAPDGSIWVAWLSFVGDRDDVAIRHYRDNEWGNIQWVPGTSGDSWAPQVAADSSNRVWVVWSQQVDGNWDIYARRFDPAEQEWSALERLTEHPLPDINPRVASDGKGEAALVWQGFRNKNCNVFLKTLDGERWSTEVRVTNRAANDWEPSATLGPEGAVWVAYDTYKNGNYDIFLSRVVNGRVQESEIPVATTPRFEARATVAADTTGRFWVAWEAGRPNWGKDQGYIIRDRQPGVRLGEFRESRIRCYQNGRWLETEAPLVSAYQRGNTHQPHVFSDGQGSVWVIAKTWLTGETQPRRGYWEYWATRLEGDHWTPAFALPNSKGRSSTYLSAALDAQQNLWLAWPTDNRAEAFYHRPIRQQVYAARLPAPAPPAQPAMKAAVEEKVEVKPGHADEASDVQAIRAYTVSIDGKSHHIVRGDFHRHTELSWDNGGGTDGSLVEFYRYMIDAAAMDFGASTDHQGGAWPYWWWYTQKMTDMYHAPGAYVPIFGYERSTTYPYGHRNVFFAKRSESRVTPFILKDGAQGFGLGLSPHGDEPGVGTGALVANDTKLLYEEIRPRNGIAISHTSATRMGTDWRDNDPDLEPVVEIFQGCRTNYEALGAPYAAEEPGDADHMKRAGYYPEGMVSNAWAKGYKLGIIASSDHNSTHISYAMVYTDDPSREGVLNAIRKRHTYGATDNIIVDVRMGGHFMGDEFSLSKAEPLRVKARGTRPITKVEIIKDNKVVYSTEPKQQNADFQFTDRGDVAGRHFYYVRLLQEDGMIAWSSPMFVNYAQGRASRP